MTNEGIDVEKEADRLKNILDELFQDKTKIQEIKIFIQRAYDAGYQRGRGRVHSLLDAERCPNCPDQGWRKQPNHSTWEPEQVQREWCWTNPKSFFKAIAAYESNDAGERRHG